MQRAAKADVSKQACVEYGEGSPAGEAGESSRLQFDLERGDVLMVLRNVHQALVARSREDQSGRQPQRQENGLQKSISV